MFDFLKNIFHGKAGDASSVSESVRGVETTMAYAPEEAQAVAAEATQTRPAMNGNGDGVEVSLQAVLGAFPLDLKGRIRQSDVGEATVSIPTEKVLAQLAAGSVRITFGELRRAAPQLFAPGSECDQVQVPLPLNEILLQVDPALLPRRMNQKRIEIPEEIRSPFGDIGNSLIFSVGPNKVENPVAAARATTPAAPTRTEMPAPPSRSVTPAPPRAEVPPAQARIVTPIPPTKPAPPAPPVQHAAPSAPVRPVVPPAPPVQPKPAAPAVAQPARPPVAPVAAPAPARPPLSPLTPPQPATAAKTFMPAAPHTPIRPPAAVPTTPITPIAATAPPITPISPVAPVIPVAPPFSPMAPTAATRAPISPAGVQPTPPVARPAAPAPEVPSLSIPLMSLVEAWPESLRYELVQMKLLDAQLVLPVEAVEQSLKRGRIAFPWKALRACLRPQPVQAVSAHDGAVVELPLKVVAPLFLNRQKEAGKAQQKVAIDEEIPNLFFGGQPAEQPGAAPAPSDTSMRRAAPAPSDTSVRRATPASSDTAMRRAAAASSETGMRVASTAPASPTKSSETNFFSWEDGANAVGATDTQFQRKTAPAPGTNFVTRCATPNEVVSRAAALDGVAGALIALPDGLMVASRLSTDLNGDTLAAFLPQIFSKVSQCTKELRMGELNNLNFTVGNVPWKIFRVNAIFFAAFGRPGQPLPTAQLVALAAELDRKKQ